MGNVQSEATQETETTKDGEEKVNLDRRKPECAGPNGTKQGAGSRAPDPQATKPSKDVSQTQGTEPGGGDRQAGAAEVGKSHSSKSKLKLCSMWPQNAHGGRIEEGASLCDKEPAPERQGLACRNRTDLRTDHSTGPVLPEEHKGTKAALRPPQVTTSDPRDPGTKRAVAKGKSKTENVSLCKNIAGLWLQPEKPTEPGREIVAGEDAAEPKIGWAEQRKSSPKPHSECERQTPGCVPCIRKQPESSAQVVAPPLNVTEDPSAGPKSPNKRNADKPAPLSGVASSSGGKKALLSWGSGHWEKEPAGQRDSAPGSDGDSKGPVPGSPLVAECAATSSNPVEKQPLLGSDAKAEAQDEADGTEAVSSETMQELLERGLNFLYKVTIQPGQWPPSIKAVKQKAGLVPSGLSYADVLKQCPQQAPAGAPALPKAMHHLAAAGKKLPAFKGLERSDSEDISLLSQLFLEHFKKVTPTELGGSSSTPSQQAVTFPEELPATHTKRPEWQRARPPTPYPQRRRGQGRKLPKFRAAQVVTILGSDSKSDWFVQDESQTSSEEVGMAAEEEGRGPVDHPSGGDQGDEEVGSSPSIAALLMEQDIAVAVDEKVQRSRRKTLVPDEGARETVALKSSPCNSARGVLPMAATARSFQTEDRPATPRLSPKSHRLSERPELSSLTIPAPVVPVGLAPDQKVPAMAQARPKLRKQGPAALKSKEKLKSSGQPKIKASKGKGQKQWASGGGLTSPLKLDSVPLFPAFEEVARPFYFGEPLEAPPSPVQPTTAKEDAAATEDGPEQEQRDPPHPPKHHQWPAFQVAGSCSQKCYCKHQHARKLPKTVMAWLNPPTNHLVEPPWVATTLLAVSLVAGTKFCMDSYKQQQQQQQVTNED